ncbi:MAG: nitrilase [Firmicutes bacterium]|nr:nitrilase [Bacillota bacterium]
MLERWIENYFTRKLNPQKLAEHVRRINSTPSKEAQPKPSGNVKVACIQKQVIPVETGEEYAERISGFVKTAAQQGCRLVVFPEYNFFDFFGLLPGFKDLNRYLNKKAKAKTSSHGSSGNSGTGALLTLFSAVAQPTEAAILAIISQLAEIYGVYIYTGSYLVKETEGLYNAGSLVGPDGELIGTQKKIHLTDFEAEIGICRSDSLAVFPLDIGTIAIPICMDATYFETFQLARNLGADIVVIPIANNEEYNLWRALRGIWPRVQESYVYGLKASLNGWLGGMHFTGKAGIFAPIELTKKKDGVVAIAENYQGDAVVVAELDLARLAQARKDAEYYGDSNPAFEAELYAKTYGRG